MSSPIKRLKELWNHWVKESPSKNFHFDDPLEDIDRQPVELVLSLSVESAIKVIDDQIQREKDINYLFSDEYHTNLIEITQKTIKSRHLQCRKQK